jgi:hypothetical protein
MLEGRSGFYNVAQGAAPGELPLGLLPADGQERLRALAEMGSVEEILVACPPSMKVGALVRTMTALSRTIRESAPSGRRGSREDRQEALRFVVTPDLATMERALSMR